MMVPRAFRYTSPISQSPPSEKSSGIPNHEAQLRWTPPKKRGETQTRPVDIQYDRSHSTTKPVAVPNARDRTRSREYNSLPTHGRRTPRGNGPDRAELPHDSTALPPAVAALLAVTAIPPRRVRGTARRRATDSRRMSIDELVHEWRTDDLVNESLGTSPVLSALLEVENGGDDHMVSESMDERPFLRTRSTSCESMPSLEGDEHSVLSLRSPSTPGSIRSRRSLNNLKRDKARSLPVAEECASNHPLVECESSTGDETFETLFMASANGQPTTTKSKSFFRSNLTSSLQALKTAALNSITSLSRSNASSNSSTGARTKSVAPFADDMLWSHPFLFPHFSSEVRPQASSATPTEAGRRYLNPMPLTFEEQEAPFQQALHAPYLAQGDEADTAIPMQTYTRSNGRRKSRSSTASEAGRVLLGVSGVRQREPRENSDFLRVVVLEMNMRRRGKIEGGRAKIWLPPRETVMTVSPLAEYCDNDEHDDDDDDHDRYEPRADGTQPRRRVIPRRWLGVSAY